MTSRPTTAQARMSALLELSERRAPSIQEPIDAELGPLPLLLRASEWRNDGVAALRDGEKRHLVLFHAGTPVDIATSPDPTQDGFARWLLHVQGALSPAEYEQAHVAMERYNVGFQEALHRGDLMSPSRVLAHHTAWLEWRLADLLSSHGRFTYTPIQRLPYPIVRVALRLPQFGLRHLLHTQPSRRLAVTYANHVPTPVTPPPFDLEALFTLPAPWSPERSLIQDARYLFKHMDGSRQLRELHTKYTRWLGWSAPSNPFDQLLLALLQLGLITLERRGRRTVEDSNWETVRQVRELRHRVTQATSPFEVLGVHWSSPEHVIVARYNEALQGILPSRYPEPLRETLYDDLVTIRDRLNAARDQLATQRLRHAARQQHVTEADMAQALRLYQDQLKMLMLRKAHERAQEVCLKALELHPRHPQALRTMKRLALSKESAPIAPPKRAPTGLDQIRFS